MFNSSLGEFFQLPQFLTHFTEHRTQDQRIGIGDFIWMHYIGHDQNTQDQDRDMELPFKKIDDHFSFEVASFPGSKFISENRFEVIDTCLPALFKTNRPKDPALASLFRPPCQA
ncbi:hypothetical protein [Fluviicola sp.]|uniref:hypothetical protein n=1 Tax=Fluviicola sp. TaxID=1917219 RepID=UPI0031DE85CE